ncbi:MAG: hypothetical protein ABSG16_10465 [Candidatus Acidiferrum sp.]|jgi:hypothetical protein
MQIARRLLIGVGAIALVAALLTLAAPKSAHALVAALVQVTNTTANPAVTLDADKATRIPYESSSQAAGFAGTCGETIVCQFDGFTVVPAGYRLVVQQIAAVVGVNSASPTPNGYFASLTGDVGGAPLDYFTGTYITKQGEAIFHQAVLEYINAGSAPTLLINGDLISNESGYAIVTGYLENCSVTGCPPIQN